jgi:metal-responsive CopG/Arc/MetJ family transcriptional regulator
MAMKPTTFRFDERFLAKLDGLAKSMSSSRAAVIRQAVGRYALEYDLRYRDAQRFIERLRERHSDAKVITLAPGEDEALEVLIDGQRTDEATAFSVEILKGRDQDGFWVSEQAEVYLRDSKADDPVNLILGTIPIGPKGERRVGLSIRIGELRPEDVDFHTRPYHFHDGDAPEETAQPPTVEQRNA